MREPACRCPVRVDGRDPDLRDRFLTTPSEPRSRPPEGLVQPLECAALSQGHIDAEWVRDLLAEQPFDDGLAEERPAVYSPGAPRPSVVPTDS
jgi:hypothetical protein